MIEKGRQKILYEEGLDGDPEASDAFTENINTVNTALLILLPGIGPKTMVKLRHNVVLK